MQYIDIITSCHTWVDRERLHDSLTGENWNKWQKLEEQLWNPQHVFSSLTEYADSLLADCYSNRKMQMIWTAFQGSAGPEETFWAIKPNFWFQICYMARMLHHTLLKLKTDSHRKILIYLKILWPTVQVYTWKKELSHISKKGCVFFFFPHF